MPPVRRHLAAVLGACLPCLAWAAGETPANSEFVEVIDVSPVWSGHPVGFALLTHKDRQHVAFYDAERRMTVASRRLGSGTWELIRLPERIGWDSHNYITMTFDHDDYIHLSGNMHGHPLVYFRSTKPNDSSTLARVPAMVGRDEDRCTYPQFLRGPDGELIFTYRIGGSGDGDQVFNTYDTSTRTWRRLLDAPLLSGGGEMNAYFTGPVRDPDGVFHLCWVWRDTPDCATNHDLSYARSRDLVHWQTSSGKPLRLPITLRTGEVVDPVPIHGGMINGNTRLGFDSRKRPVISYHKFDEQGFTQIYNARLEDGRWKIHQVSDWSYRWEFQGGGSIPFEIRLSAVAPVEGGLRQSFSNPKHGSGIWLLDEATLRPIRMLPKPPPMPAEVRKIELKVPGMSVQTQADTGRSPEPGTRYLLKWETLGRNRDRPRQGDPPPPSMLRLYEIHSPATGEQFSADPGR